MKHICSFLSAFFLLAGSYLFTRIPDIGSNLPLFYTGFVMAFAGFIGLIIFKNEGFLISILLPPLFPDNSRQFVG